MVFSDVDVASRPKILEPPPSPPHSLRGTRELQIPVRDWGGVSGDFRSPDISISDALSFEGDRDHSSFPDVNFSQPIGLVLVSLGVRKRVGTGRKRKRQE